MIKTIGLYSNRNLLFLLLISFCAFFSNGYSQVLPDYKERTFALNPDSLASLAAGNVEMGATEGSVNPYEYLVGPGDKIFISISGIEEIPLDLLVNQEGVLYIPKVGGVDLNGLTLKASKEKIRKAINTYYKNIDVFISLGDFKKPSTFVMPANSRLIDLIMNSAGLNKTSNFRNIRVIHRDSTERTYDLLSFLRLGNRAANPMMREGDAVIVDHVDQVVSRWGMIKYPGIYEFIDGETIDHLITIACG